MDKRKILLATNSMLVLALVWIIIQAMPVQDKLKIAAGRNISAEQDRAPETSAPPPEFSQTNYNEILNRNLFETAQTTDHTDEPAEADAGIAVSKLNLVLQGTITGPPQIARALIEDLSTNTAEHYKIGDLIAGARIEEINKHTVTLICGGRRTTLELNADKPHSSPNSSDTSLQVTTPVEEPRTSSQIRNEIFEDFLTTARIEPHIVNNQAQGLRISNLKNLEAAKLIGLENGDVIRIVNGQELTSKQKAFQVFKKAKTQPYLNIELLRDNKVKTLSFP